MSDDKNDFLDLLSLNGDGDNVDDDSSSNEDFVDPQMKLAESLTDAEIQQITLAEALRAIGTTTTVIEEIKDMVIMGGTAEFADAYAKLVKSQTDAIKIVGDIALQNKRLEVQKEIKLMDIAGKKEVLDHKAELEFKDNPKLTGHTTNNNLIVTNREDIFNKLFGDQEEDKESVFKKDAIEVESESSSDN